MIPGVAVVVSLSWILAVGRANQVAPYWRESRLEWQQDLLPRILVVRLVSLRRVWEEEGEGLVVAMVVASSSLALVVGRSDRVSPDLRRSQLELQRDQRADVVVTQCWSFGVEHHRWRCCGRWWDAAGMLIVFAAATLLLGKFLCKSRDTCRRSEKKIPRGRRTCVHGVMHLLKRCCTSCTETVELSSSQSGAAHGGDYRGRKGKLSTVAATAWEVP